MSLSNFGHGWVTPRADGAVARCGGPKICAVCQGEQRLVDLQQSMGRLEDSYQTVHEVVSRLTVDRDALQHQLTASAARSTELERGLKFYADGNHLLLADPDEWDTCSGEPINFLHDSAGTASVEDGSIAKQILAQSAPATDEQREKPDPVAADAARYRFLRDGERAGLEYWDNEPVVCTDEMSHTGDDLDRVIDNAIESMRARAAGEGE